MRCIAPGEAWSHTYNPLHEHREIHAAVNFLLILALFGSLILIPLYYQVVRHDSPLQIGLLLGPQGIGAALALPVAGWLTDKIGARPQNNPIDPPQVLASIYQGMGINLDTTMMPGPGSRPIRLVEAEPIRQLFA